MSELVFLLLRQSCFPNLTSTQLKMEESMALVIEKNILMFC